MYSSQLHYCDQIKDDELLRHIACVAQEKYITMLSVGITAREEIVWETKNSVLKYITNRHSKFKNLKRFPKSDV